MTKRERVLAALSGAPVDRVPIAFWLHNFATENSAEGLAAESLRLAKTFKFGGAGLTFSAEAFNVLNNDVVLSRSRQANTGTFISTIAGAVPGSGRIEEIIAPRILRVGVNFAF